MRSLVALALMLVLCSLASEVRSASPSDSAPIKIAVMTDMAGVYEAPTGRGSALAAQMAIDDFGGKVLGRPVQLTVIDHRNNGPESAIKAREFFDGGGDMIVDLANSAVALAVGTVGKERHKLVLVTGAASSALTGPACNKYMYHYTYDSYAMAHSTGSSVASSPDLRKWYMIYPNYAFGTAMLADFGNAIKAKGGEIVHADATPLGTADYSPYLLSAKNSDATVLGVLSAGVDVANTMKGFKQFGLDKKMKPAIGLLTISEVDGNPDLYAGARVTTSWYWAQNKESRAWSDRFTAKRGGGIRPTDVQASDYSATWQYLSAVKAVGSTDADKLVAYLDGRQFNDFYAYGGEWRARDHRVIHEMYVVDVLPRALVKEPHAWFKIVQVIPPAVAFRPESQSTCKKDW